MRLLRPSSCFAAAFLIVAGNSDVALSQEYQISGSILSAADGSPLVGASVELKGSIGRALTGAAGAYEIADEIAIDTLVFSMTGFHSVEVPINRVVGIESSPLPTVVVPVESIRSGYFIYDHLRPPTLVVPFESSRSVINVSLQPLTNELGRMLIRLNTQSGIVVANIESRPGPLYVIDGVLANGAAFNALNPQMIDSVSLQVGDASARFGEAGRNGVVVVITKSEGRAAP